MDWQPIETAPKDGPYLVFGSLNDGRYSSEPRAYIAESGAYGEEPRKRFMVEEGSVYLEPSYGTATHWMPLPNPPSVP